MLSNISQTALACLMFTVHTDIKFCMMMQFICIIMEQIFNNDS